MIESVKKQAPQVTGPASYKTIYTFGRGILSPPIHIRCYMNNDTPLASKETTIIIPGPAGKLEIATTLSDKDLAFTGVICHPHPLFGGTMDNKVVTTVARSMRALGMATVRFNFRGVGASTGHYDQGFGESEDLLAVLQWVKQMRPSDHIFLAGFSFGSYIAARTASCWPIMQLITIAPPVNHFDFDNFPKPQASWLVIQGDQDEVVPVKEVITWVEAQTMPIQLIIMPNTSHFFHGHLTDLRQLLSESLLAHMQA